jgi:hypothetical protein
MVTIVNIVPRSSSGETHQDSEPNASVNPANPVQVVATAFTPDPLGGPNAPIYVSSDGGNSWYLNPIVPGGNSITGTNDITLSFSTGTSYLYVGDLRGDNVKLNVLRGTPTAMEPWESLPQRDQPWVQAATVSGGPSAGKDRLYVGYNDFSAYPAPGPTATIGVSLDAAAGALVFLPPIKLDPRPAVLDGPQVRPVIHSDGTIYAAYYGWRASTGVFGSNTLVITAADVVVVRDDNWGSGAAPFTALGDPGDHLPGLRVVQGASFPFHISGFMFGYDPGQNRRMGNLTMAVDPRASATVYLAYADVQPAGYTVHVRRSTTKGVTWSADLLAVTNATNPALAISSDGTVGLLYQQVTGASSSLRWETHLRQTLDGNVWSDLLLATTPAGSPAGQFDPYLGDYLYLAAVDTTFYGIFCANNTPDLGNFPQGVVYQRNADFRTHTLLDVDGRTPVAPSIDPFFFTTAPLIAKGVLVPDLTGQTLGKAEEILFSAGLQLGGVSRLPPIGPPPYGPATVFAQDPVAGTLVPRGSKVNVQLQREHKPPE